MFTLFWSKEKNWDEFLFINRFNIRRNLEYLFSDLFEKKKTCQRIIKYTQTHLTINMGPLDTTKTMDYIEEVLHITTARCH